eukprot:scaffold152833_cov21-Tisochrysis_lutea.AAC.1
MAHGYPGAPMQGKLRAIPPPAAFFFFSFLRLCAQCVLNSSHLRTGYIRSTIHIIHVLALLAQASVSACTSTLCNNAHAKCGQLSKYFSSGKHVQHHFVAMYYGTVQGRRAMQHDYGVPSTNPYAAPIPQQYAAPYNMPTAEQQQAAPYSQLDPQHNPHGGLQGVFQEGLHPSILADRDQLTPQHNPLPYNP